MAGRPNSVSVRGAGRLGQGLTPGTRFGVWYSCAPAGEEPRGSNSPSKGRSAEVNLGPEAFVPSVQSILPIGRSREASGPGIVSAFEAGGALFRSMREACAEGRIALHSQRRSVCLRKRFRADFEED